MMPCGPYPTINDASQEFLIQNRMAAAFTVVGGFFVERAVVVEEDQMLAFVADYVRDARKVSLMFGENEGAWVERQHHAGGIDEPALIIGATSILTGGHGDIG